MIYIAIAAIILILNIAPQYLQTDKARSEAYQWWPFPWLAFVYVVVMIILFLTIDVPRLLGSLTLLGNGVLEVCYVLLCQFLWLVVTSFVNRKSLHERWIPWFRKAFAAEADYPDRVLPFPYFIDHMGVVRARVGRCFYRRLVGTVVGIVAVVHALYFLVMAFVDLPFYLLSAFGLFGLVPLIEYYKYLLAEVPEEEDVDRGEPTVPPSDLEKLWKLYIEVFNNYSVAWRRRIDGGQVEAKNNVAQVSDLLKKLITDDSSRGNDGFLENCDLAQAFARMEQLFSWVEQNGKLVLVAFDVPNHFKKKEKQSYLQETAEVLRKILRTELAVFDEYSSETVLESSIVIASLSVLSSRGFNEEWLRRIGLVTMVNLQDRSVANLYECRRFSYLLRAVNNDYQMLFITPHLRGVEPALKNNWITGAATEEKRLRQHPVGYHQFFIGYHFEDYISRYLRLMPSLPNEPLSSISEMAPIALSYQVGESRRVITPVHFFDLAYTNIVEGKEELNKFYTSKFYLVEGEALNAQIHHHLLPIEVIDEAQMFAVIFDQDNNAPAAYAKWCHLGHQENFSVVISRPYLFRDYFNANFAYFAEVPFIALQPQLSKSRVTLAVVLLSMLQKSGLEEQQLRGLLQGYYQEEETRSLAETVKQLFTNYFSNDLAGRLRTTHNVVFDGSRYQHQTVYNLDFSDQVTLSYLDLIYVKDESDNVLFTIIHDLMSQNFEKGQIHSFLGKPYMIQWFEEGNKVLRVRAVNTPASEVVFYRPVRKIFIQGERRPIEDLKSEPSWNHHITKEKLRLKFEGFETETTVSVRQWYEFYQYTTKDCNFIDLEQPTERSYENGRVLKVTMHYVHKEEYQKRIEDIRKSLQILIYEAMWSIFPHYAQYLIVSSKGEGDKDLPWIFNEFRCDDKDEPYTLSFYFTEDAHIDLGLLGVLAQKDNFGADYLFRYIYDYLLWLTEGKPASSADFDEYLFNSEMDKFAFLKYGREALPAYFDVNLLINFIRDFFCERNHSVLYGTKERNKRQEVFGTCDFCRRTMKNSEMQALDDGRMRCPDCSEGAIDSTQRFLELCDEVKAAFKAHLGIDLSQTIFTSNLVPAVELHKVGGYEFSVTNGYDVRKFVGLAVGTENIYVENGYKEDSTYGIIAHEMTHIWEFGNEDFLKVRKTNEYLVEGLAVWTDLFLSEKHGRPNIESLRNGWLSRDDEYGRGLRFIMENCPTDPYGYIRDKAKQL